MARYRKNRINESVREEVSLILRDVKDPRVADAMITVTSAEVSGDLKYAKIYYSAIGGDEKEIGRGLRSSAGYIRRRLAEGLNLRITPELSFIEDGGVRHGAEIASILKEIGASGGSRETAEDGENE